MGALQRGHLGSDVMQSLRNAAMLGTSLLATWAVALVVRIFLPRHLGPEAFGAFQFADAFTVTLFAATGLGIEMYVRKEVATRPAHASDFFAGTLLMRLALGAVFMVAAVVSLEAAGKPANVLSLIVILGVTQLIANVSATYGAILQSAGSVSGLSVLNVVAKVVWGVGVLGAFIAGGGMTAVAAMMLASEVLRVVGLAILARRHVGLRFRIDMRASAAVVAAAVPFYLNTLALVAYARIDVSMMSFLASDIEVGWYGAAANIAGLSLMLSPLIGWVLIPLAARAAARSRDELTIVTRRAMELVLAVAFPAALILALGAKEIVITAFGVEFAPAVSSLRLLAPTFILTYVAMVCGSILVQLGRGWALTRISLLGMVLSPLLNYWMIPWGLRTYGAGGAGDGAAIALVITESVTAGSMAFLLGRRAFDRRGVTALAKTFLVCAVVVVADRLLAPIHAWRLVVDAMLYGVLVFATGAVDASDAVSLLRSLARGRTQATTA
jgi:O-antigen/teichoic acid export membrane protein